MLGQIRSKFSSVPIPGENITLNGEALLVQAKEEKETLKNEIQKILEETTYQKLAETTSELSKLTNETLTSFPLRYF